MPESDSSSQVVHPAPLARGLTNWPAKPPTFDPLHEAESTSAPRDAFIADNLGSLMDRLAACNVRAARRDSPDLHEQLRAALKRPIDTVICSVMDVDPSACIQSTWAAQHPEDIIAGINALAKACNASRRLIVVDDRAPSRWWIALRSAARSVDRSIRIVEIENDFPQADPSLLCYTLLSRRLKPGKSPAEVGVILLDAVACAAIGACVSRGQSLTHTPICVRDHDRSESYFLTAAIGTSVRHILHTLGLHALGALESDQADDQLLLRAGDVLRDQRIDLETVVSEADLLFHVSTMPPALNPDPCIRCGWCFEACPTRIQPANLLEAAQREDLVLATRAGLASCIECGVCAYVCPSRLPILQGIRSIRAYERDLEIREIR